MIGLLTRNAELRSTSAAEQTAVWGWSIPALAARLDDGRIVKTCPAAGVCALACYARRGRYRFRNVAGRHRANLARLLDDLDGWRRDMIAEVARKRRPCAVRIHDAGDFFSDPYLAAWCSVAESAPDVRFYTYTKEVARYRRVRDLVDEWPPNFVVRLSYGGQEDALIEASDLVADVFPTAAAVDAADWVDNTPSDLMAADPAVRQLGIPANHLRDALRRAAGRRFSEWQSEADATHPDQTPPAAPTSTCPRPRRTTPRELDMTTTPTTPHPDLTLSADRVSRARWGVRAYDDGTPARPTPPPSGPVQAQFTEPWPQRVNQGRRASGGRP